MVGAIGQEQQQLAQLLPPGAGLPEHGQGIGQGAKAAAGAIATRLLRRRSLLEEKQYSCTVSISHWRR